MRFRFGQFELDADRFELRRNGSVVSIQPKVLELILYLVRHRNRAVSSDELLSAVWPATRVTKSSLNRAVSLARGILDEGTSPISMIATVARLGYRIGALVELVPDASERDDPARHYVGRQSYRARAEAALHAALAGRGRILLLVGEGGIGKTRTAELLANAARAGRAEVAAAWRIDRSSPAMWGWQRVLGQIMDADPTLFQALPAHHRTALARLVGVEASSGGGSGEPREQPPFQPDASHRDSSRVALFDAVSACLTEVARQRPLLLVFDDLHAADAETLGLLERIGRSISDLPVAVVATAREEDTVMSRQQAREFERLLRLGSVERLALTGLHDGDFSEFVARRLGRTPPATLLGALERQTGGNPLLLAESLASLEARGLLGEDRMRGEWESLLPKGIDHLLRPKLRQLSESAVELLGLASGLGLDVDRATLARSFDSPSRFEASLEELVEDGLLVVGPAASRVRFGHALIREAVYASLVPPGTERQRLHARLFSIVAPSSERESADARAGASELAMHACEAVPWVPPREAAGFARAAARQAAELFDFAGATVWYARAVAVLDLVPTPDVELAALLRLELAQARSRAEGLERARPAYFEAASAARSAGRDDLLARAALGLAARPNSTGEEDPEVVGLLEEAREALRPGQEALEIRLASRLAAELRYSQRSRSERLCAEALRDARKFGDPGVLAETLEDATFLRWSPEDPASWVELNAEVAREAMRAGDTDLAMSGHKGCVSGCLELGDLVAAERAIRACERIARAVPTAYARWWCLVLRASQALIDGEFELAEARIVESMGVADRIDSPEVAIELKAQFCYLRTEQGRAGEIEAAAREQLRLFPQQPIWRAAYARILIGEGRVGEARDVFAPLVEDGFREIPIDRGWMGTHALAAEIACGVGDVAAARALEEQLRPFAGRAIVLGSAVYYGPTARFLGSLAAVQGRFDEAVGHFESAIAATQRAGARLMLARTRVEFARALLARAGEGDRARSARLVQDAIGIAERRGFVAVLRDARVLEGAVWSPDRTRTSRDRRVSRGGPGQEG